MLLNLVISFGCSDSDTSDNNESFPLSGIDSCRIPDTYKRIPNTYTKAEQSQPDRIVGSQSSVQPFETSSPTSPSGYCTQCIQNDIKIQHLQCLISQKQERHRRKKFSVIMAKIEAKIWKSLRRKSDVTSKRRCSICLMRMRADRLLGHICRDSVKSIACEYCALSFGSTMALQQHLTVVHEDSVNKKQCDICVRLFDSKLLYDFHMAAHKSNHGDESRDLKRFQDDVDAFDNYLMNDKSDAEPSDSETSDESDETDELTCKKLRNSSHFPNSTVHFSEPIFLAIPQHTCAPYAANDSKLSQNIECI